MYVADKKMTAAYHHFCLLINVNAPLSTLNVMVAFVISAWLIGRTHGRMHADGLFGHIHTVEHV